MNDNAFYQATGVGTNAFNQETISKPIQKAKVRIENGDSIDNILYDTLKVSRTASLAEIQNAYEREYILITSSVESLMDVNLQKIQLLNAAYNVLTNPEVRKVYDKSGIAGVNQMQEKIQENEKNQKKYADNYLYDFFGVSRFSDDAEIRMAYLNILKTADYSDKERIKLIHSVYGVLTVPEIRKVYDEEGIEGINKNFTTIQFDPNVFRPSNSNENSSIPNSDNGENNYDNLLYETLGVGRDASSSQIRFAYQKKMKEIQQKYGFIDDESEEVQLINASFNVLYDPKLRSVYDVSGILGINKLQEEGETNENQSNSTEEIHQNQSNENSGSNYNSNNNNYNSNNNNYNSNNNNYNSNSNNYNSNNNNYISNDNNNNSSSNNNNSNDNNNSNNSSGDNLLYDAVGVSRDASFIQIQMAFLKKLNETVNDDDSEKSQLLHAAYNVLSDPELRRIYDSGGIGAINKVYEERAEKKEEQEQKEEQQTSPKDDIFITSSKPTSSLLEDIDSDDDFSSNEHETDIFHLFDDEEIINNNEEDEDEDEDEDSKNDENNETSKKDEDSSPTVDVELTLEQLFNGCLISTNIQMDVACPHCKGTGNEYGTPFPKCPVCNGSGQKVVTIEKPSDFLTSQLSGSTNEKQKFQMKRICEKCLGRGELRTDYATCCVCYGLKEFKSDFKCEVEIKSGTVDGEIIKVPLKIENEVKFVNFRIIQKKHDLFERIGNDLIYTKKINLEQSLCGSIRFPIETLDKRIIVVNGSENIVIQPNSSFVIKNEGFPIKNNESLLWNLKKGDLIIKFVVEMPSVFAIGPKVINLLKKIQPLNDNQISYDRSRILKDKMYFYQLPYESVS